MANLSALRAIAELNKVEDLNQNGELVKSEQNNMKILLFGFGFKSSQIINLLPEDKNCEFKG